MQVAPRHWLAGWRRQRAYRTANRKYPLPLSVETRPPSLIIAAVVALMLCLIALAAVPIIWR